MQCEVRLSEIIAPTFWPVYRAVKNEEFTHYWLKGGRSSTKSSFISIAILMGIMEDPQANAVLFMKIGNSLNQAVYEQMLWALNALHVSEYFTTLRSPMKFIYKPTGQIIIFKGLDEAAKTKSIKTAKGYFKYIWFEELSEFDSWEEIRTTLNSLFRKGDTSIKAHFSVFYSYNPPSDPSSWVNKETKVKRSDRLIHHSTYLDVPNEWLTDAFVQEAEELKRIDITSYNHEYLGEVTGVTGKVYKLFSRERHVIDSLEPNERVYSIYCGLDEGTITDDTTCVCALVTTHGRIVIPVPFDYDPKVIGHGPLSHTDQSVLIARYLVDIANEFNYKDDFGRYGSIVGWVDSSEAGQELGLTLNTYLQQCQFPCSIQSVGKKEIISDVLRVQGLLKVPNLLKIINGPYLDPLDRSRVLGEDNPLVVELETMIVNEKTKKPEDGDDHNENALRYLCKGLSSSGII